MRMSACQQTNRNLENTRENQLELKNTITEMKNTLEGINSRLNDTENWISNLEGRRLEITQSESKKKKENFQ